MTDTPGKISSVGFLISHMLIKISVMQGDTFERMSWMAYQNFKQFVPTTHYILRISICGLYPAKILPGKKIY